jgi:hypothetical protein
MAYEQAFGKMIDNEHLFVLQWSSSEQTFEEGDAMSVAFELDYEVFSPGLRLVRPAPATAQTVEPVWVRHRRAMLLGLVAAVLLVLLMLPIRSLGGKTLAASAPTAGQEYVVHSGDTLASIATQVVGSHANGSRLAVFEQRLVGETGSTVLVPGEHLLIP